MTNQNPKENVLHPEVAVALLIAGVFVTLGLLTTIWMETWTPTLVALTLAFGTLFVAACIPQIKAAVARQNEQRK
jgi:hypothetical protein